MCPDMYTLRVEVDMCRDVHRHIDMSIYTRMLRRHTYLYCAHEWLPSANAAFYSRTFGVQIGLRARARAQTHTHTHTHTHYAHVVFSRPCISALVCTCAAMAVNLWRCVRPGVHVLNMCPSPLSMHTNRHTAAHMHISGAGSSAAECSAVLAIINEKRRHTTRARFCRT